MVCECIAALVLLPVAYFAIRWLILERFVLPDLEKRAVFVTGCDTGFGRMLALKLARAGIPTFAGCFGDATAESLRKEAEGAPGKLVTLPLDVSKNESVKAAVETVKKGLGPNEKLWAIVNNAGILLYEGPSEWVPVESYNTTFNVNLVGVVRVCQAFLPLLRQSKGRIVTVASCAGRTSLYPLSSYAVSKFAVEAFMDNLRREIASFGISCHILEPGRFKTDILSSTGKFPKCDAAYAGLDEEVRSAYGDAYKEACDGVFRDALDGSATPHVELVIDAYFHAVTARFPKLRYVCGWDAKLMIIPLSFLPTGLQDYLIGFLMTQPIPAAAESKAKAQ